MTEGQPNVERRLARAEQRLASIGELARSLAPTSEEAMAALADCERALKRAGKRAAALPGEYERVELVQERGPTIEFTGRLVCETRWTTGDGETELQVWETEAGAYVAVEEAPRYGGTVIRAGVIPASEDRQTMRFAVLDFFGWGTRARSMVVKAGWSLRLEAE